jgi:NAD(P)H-nitrite reductase large subunit
MPNNQSLLSQRPDYVVCTCFEVMYSDIVAAIHRGCNDFKALSSELGVGTGCSNCVPEVHQILNEELKKKKN